MNQPTTIPARRWAVGAALFLLTCPSLAVQAESRNFYTYVSQKSKGTESRWTPGQGQPHCLYFAAAPKDSVVVAAFDKSQNLLPDYPKVFPPAGPDRLVLDKLDRTKKIYLVVLPQGVPKDVPLRTMLASKEPWTVSRGRLFQQELLKYKTSVPLAHSGHETTTTSATKATGSKTVHPGSPGAPSSNAIPQGPEKKTLDQVVGGGAGGSWKDNADKHSYPSERPTTLILELVKGAR